MALVICPECKKQMSQHAEICLNCGFPIQKFMTENDMNDETKAFVCPKCADTYKLEGVMFLKCEFCNTTLVQTDISSKELFRLGCNISDEEFRSKAIEMAKKYGNNQFDEKAYRETELKKEQRNLNFMNSSNISQSQQENTPKCPTCGSKNVKKISTTEKAINIGLFGVFGNKRKKQFHCSNCGYEW